MKKIVDYLGKGFQACVNGLDPGGKYVDTVGQDLLGEVTTFGVGSNEDFVFGYVQDLCGFGQVGAEQVGFAQLEIAVGRAFDSHFVGHVVLREAFSLPEILYVFVDLTHDC